jgi:hypothetical protein
VRGDQVLSHGGCVVVVRNRLATYVALAPRDLDTPRPKCKLPCRTSSSKLTSWSP